MQFKHIRLSSLILLQMAALPFVALSQSAPAATNVKLSLKQAIAYGLTYHPTVSIYKMQENKANQEAKEQLANYLPQVNLSSGLDYNIELQKTVIPENTFGPGTPRQIVAFGQKYNANLAGQVDQQLINMELLTGLQANKPNKELAALTAEENNQNIIYNISASYFQIITIQKQLELLNANKERFTKILEVTQLQADLGVAKKVDVKQVQVNLNNVNTQIKNLENNLDLAENQLKNNMGLPLNQEIELTDLENWTQVAIANTPPSYAFDYYKTYNYLKQEKQLELLDINVRRIRNRIFPVVSAYAQYGYLGFGANLKDAYNPLLDFSKVGIKLSWSIFSGFRRDAQYKQAQIDYDIAKTNLDYNQQLATLQFQNAKLKFSNANATIALNKQNMDLAKEVFDNATLQYNEGVASLAELLNAELAFRESQNIYISSLVDYYRADLDIQKNNNTLQTFFQELP